MITRTTSIAFAALAAASLLAVATGCSESGSSAGTTGSADAGPAGLIQPGTLNLCLSLSYEPLEYYEKGTSGKIIGWDVDSARALAKSWGVDTKITVMDFDGMIPGLQTGKCDLVWSGMYVNEKRTQVTDAVPVLRTGSEVFLTKSAAKKVTKVDDLCGLRLATQTGSTDDTHLQEISAQCTAKGKPAIAITGYPGSVDSIPSIRSGKLDGLIDTNTLVATLAKKNTDLVAVPGLFPADYYFGAFTDKGSPISAEVKKGIDALITDGTLAKLAEKYGLNPKDVAEVDAKAIG